MNTETGKSAWRLVPGALVGLALSTVVAAWTSTAGFPLTAERINVQDGEQLFHSRCASCHTVNASGGNKIGPGLHGIGTDAATRKPGVSALDYIVESIVHPDAFIAPGAVGRMPERTAAGLNETRMKNLVGYVAQQGGQLEYRELLSMDVPAVPNVVMSAKVTSIPNLRAGWNLFNRQLGCSACHNVFGDPGDSHPAPNLSGVARLPREYVLESIKTPSAYIVPGYRQATARLSSGEVLAGRLLNQDDRQVVLIVQGVSGMLNRVTIEQSEIESLELSDQSLMPPYSLSPDKEKLLLDFLEFLQAEV